MASWTTNLLDISHDWDSFLYSAFCYPCALASTKSNTDGSSWWMNVVAGTIFAPCSSVMFRTSIRESYGIDGTLSDDAIKALACPVCSTSQLLRENYSRGPASNAMY